MYVDFYGSQFLKQTLLIKLFCLMRYFNSKAIFELPGIDIVFEFLISAQSADLEKSASITVEAKTLRPLWLAPIGPRGLKFGM